VNQVFSLVQPYLLMVGIDRYVGAHDTGRTRRLAIIFAVAVVGEFFSCYGQSYLTMLVAQRPSPSSASPSSVTCCGCR
jgi:ABC-type bacteriocin/lantibiotic exporter with double-glycine peptidase domain